MCVQECFLLKSAFVAVSEMEELDGGRRWSWASILARIMCFLCSYVVLLY